MTLRCIGFWASGGRGDDDGRRGLPHPRDLVDPTWKDRANGKSVAWHLRAGRVLMRYRGYSWCRFDCGVAPRQLGDADLTDGRWLWPQGLAHYVTKHDVRLPDEFVADLAAGPSGVPSIREDGMPRLDFSFWLEWCARNTPPPPEAPGAVDLGRAREVVDALATASWRPRLEAAHGRWRIDHDYGTGRQVDYLAPTTRDDLEAYCHAWRVVAPGEALGIDEANRIAGETSGPCRVRVSDIEAPETTRCGAARYWGIRPGHWIVDVRSRVTNFSTTCPPLDEVGWRPQLSQWNGQSARSLSGAVDPSTAAIDLAGYWRRHAGVDGPVDVHVTVEEGDGPDAQPRWRVDWPDDTSEHVTPPATRAGWLDWAATRLPPRPTTDDRT